MQMDVHSLLAQPLPPQTKRWCLLCLLCTSFSSSALLLFDTDVGDFSTSVPSYFLWLRGTLLSGCTAVCLIGPLLMDSWVVLNCLIFIVEESPFLS